MMNYPQLLFLNKDIPDYIISILKLLTFSSILLLLFSDMRFLNNKLLLLYLAGINKTVCPNQFY